MKALVSVYPGEDVTLPPAIMDAAGIDPGDAVLMGVTGIGGVEVRVLPLPPLSDFIGQDHALADAPAQGSGNEQVGREVERDAWQGNRPVDFAALPILTVAEPRARCLSDWSKIAERHDDGSHVIGNARTTDCPTKFWNLRALNLGTPSSSRQSIQTRSP